MRRLQVNLDFQSEPDMVDKFRLGLALQPIATALFANSPLKEGKKTGYKSWRSHVWTDTDPDRCVRWCSAHGCPVQSCVEPAWRRGSRQ